MLKQMISYGNHFLECFFKGELTALYSPELVPELSMTELAY